jgi:hypothetical protein
MNRKDIETFAAIQNRLYEYCKNVLTTLAKDYPECGISDIARVVGIDVIDKYLQLTYSGYPCNLPLYIPLQYVEAEDVDGFCKAFAEKVWKEGKMLTQDEFIEKAYHQQWMRFYELFDIQMTDSEEDLDRARNKLHDLIETMTYVVQLAKRQGKTDNVAGFFTEKELPQLNGALVQFLEWAKADPFWSTRQKSERQRVAEFKAEMLKEQEETIRLIKECENRAEEELQIAQKVLENIKTKL